jgi:hypothetical protein
VVQQTTACCIKCEGTIRKANRFAKMNEYVLETSSNIQIPGKPMELRKITREISPLFSHCRSLMEPEILNKTRTYHNQYNKPS